MSFSTLQGFCREHVKLYTQKFGKEGFLHLQKVPQPVGFLLKFEYWRTQVNVWGH